MRTKQRLDGSAATGSSRREPIQPFPQIDPENSPEDVAQSNAKLRFSSQSALPA